MWVIALLILLIACAAEIMQLIEPVSKEQINTLRVLFIIIILLCLLSNAAIKQL